ncbi:hypothetical protein DXA24_04695 [Bacteroides sp. CF01-10NS]|nr:hypothetical protein DW055_15025 [Bacteroides ovatus]RJU51625.1 hypothetical protein DXA24_04695 [Bacteroides sp. CF01-10NS]
MANIERIVGFGKRSLYFIRIKALYGLNRGAVFFKWSLCLGEIMFLLERKIGYKIVEHFLERCFSLVICCLLVVYDVIKKDCRTQSGIHNKQ